MQNNKIEEKIAKLEISIKKNHDLEEIVSNLSLKEKCNAPKKITNKISKLQTSYQNANSDKAKEKVVLKFENYKNKLIYNYKKNISKARMLIKRYQNIKKWNELDDNTKQERKTDLSFYQTDTSSYWLTLSIIAFDVIYLLTMLSIMEKNFWIGIFILSNIGFLLFLFTAAIKLKNYIKLFSYLLLVFGLYCCLRISVIIPLIMKINIYSSTVSFFNKFLILFSNIYGIIISLYVGINSYLKIRRQEKYLKDGKISFKQMSK